jgi:hypothetical protein
MDIILTNKQIIINQINQYINQYMDLLHIDYKQNLLFVLIALFSTFIFITYGIKFIKKFIEYNIFLVLSLFFWNTFIDVKSLLDLSIFTKRT